MMGDLDSHEIDLLDERYEKMMSRIKSIVLNRLTNSAIIFDVKKPEDSSQNSGKTTPQPVRAHNVIAPDDPCPCGSQKKYRECHGRDIHGNSIVRRRR